MIAFTYNDLMSLLISTTVNVKVLREVFFFLYLVRRDKLIGITDFIISLIYECNGYYWEGDSLGYTPRLGCKVIKDSSSPDHPYRVEGRTTIVKESFIEEMKNFCLYSKQSSVNFDEFYKAYSTIVTQIETYVFNTLDLEDGVNFITIGNIYYKDGVVLVELGR